MFTFDSSLLAQQKNFPFSSQQLFKCAVTEAVSTWYFNLLLMDG